MSSWAAVLDAAFNKSLKAGGDCGDGGDTPVKLLSETENSSGIVGPTRDGRVGSVGTPVAAVTTGTSSLNQGGDGISTAIPLPRQRRCAAVTTDTTVSTAVPPLGDLRLYKLRAMAPLNSFGAERWRHLLIDAEGFFGQWGNSLQLRDWSDMELLGVHPRAPAARYDAMGLLLLVGRGEVVELNSDRANIRSRGGSLLVYRKHRNPDAVPLWRLT